MKKNIKKIVSKKSFRIGDFQIKEYSEVFVIAEVGVNHNGRLDLALKLVDIAKEAGANAIKFQTFKASDVVTDRGEMAAYQKKNTVQGRSQREMLHDLELPDNFYKPIIERCNKRGILFMSTPHGGKQSVDFLEELGIEVYKIGSGDLTNYILLDKVAKTKKPIILSSGMATLNEVKNTIRFIKSRWNKQIAVLHCTTNYPCLPEEVNLLAMKTMMEQLDLPIGYSDHTQDSQTAIMAACLGMAIYECHFTLDKNLPGPDHIASAEPGELKTRIEAIRRVSVILGKKEKVPNKSEINSMLILVRKSIVAAKDLEVGHVITEDDIEAKRPGDGVFPTEYEKFLDKRLKVRVKKDQQLTFEDVG